jgi:hypothetical protein
MAQFCIRNPHRIREFIIRIRNRIRQISLNGIRVRIRNSYFATIWENPIVISLTAKQMSQVYKM